MKSTFSFQLILICMFSLVIFSNCKKDDVDPDNKPNIEFYGLNNSNSIIKYNANNASTAISAVNISGLQASETMLAIDFRPATGQLYGVGSSSRIYIINQNTGVATAVGAVSFTPAIVGNAVGFDFNPTVDRIRLVSSSGQNLRINPETGAVAATDAALNPGTPAIGSVAYSNSVAGASSTILYDIDLVAGKLFKQDPPNNGTLVEVGNINITASGENGFDISPDNSTALASFTVGNSSVLHKIDLGTGKAESLGTLSSDIIGIAIPTNPVAYAVDASNNLQIFNMISPGMPVSKPISGMQAGENILGIDMRPATGQLYALGSTSRLYAINMSSGAATTIGTSTFATALSGTTFGFDFNPTVDRIRIISNNGQNLRLNPSDGTVSSVDLALNPGLPNVNSAAYSNNFAGAGSTVLFDIDAATDKLYKQSPPNDGLLVEVGNLGIDINGEAGFDIGGMSDQAYGIFTSSGTTQIFKINTTTGVASKIADYPNNIVGFAVGLGF